MQNDKMLAIANHKKYNLSCIIVLIMESYH